MEEIITMANLFPIGLTVLFKTMAPYCIAILSGITSYSILKEFNLQNK